MEGERGFNPMIKNTAKDINYLGWGRPSYWIGPLQVVVVVVVVVVVAVVVVKLTLISWNMEAKAS